MADKQTNNDSRMEAIEQLMSLISGSLEEEPTSWSWDEHTKAVEKATEQDNSVDRMCARDKMTYVLHDVLDDILLGERTINSIDELAVLSDLIKEY